MKDRDDGRLRALHDAHARALQRYVTGLTGDGGRAEDIVQETLTRAWRRADELTGDVASLRPWLFRVAHNLAIDDRRAQAGRQEQGDDGLDLLAAEDDIDRTLDARHIADALRALAQSHREVLVETYFQGRSVNEAARVLGVPAGTVKSRTYYALRALRAILDAQGWAP